MNLSLLRIAGYIWGCTNASHVFNLSFGAQRCGWYLTIRRRTNQGPSWKICARIRLGEAKILGCRALPTRYEVTKTIWIQIRKAKINDMNLEEQTNQSLQNTQFVFPVSVWLVIIIMYEWVRLQTNWSLCNGVSQIRDCFLTFSSQTSGSGLDHPPCRARWFRLACSASLPLSPIASQSQIPI